MTDRTGYDSRRATLKEIMNVLKNEPDSTELVTDSGHFQGLIKQARADEREKVLSEVEGWLVDEEIEKVNVPHVSAKRGHYVKTKDPSSYTRNKFRAELRAKLNQLKGNHDTR